MPDETRRPVVDAAGQQVGEQQVSAAGGNIYYGLDPALLRYLEGERASRDALAATAIRLHEELAEIRREARVAADDAALERGIDFEARLKRQAMLDAEVAALRRWLVSLTLATIALALILAGVVWYELGIFARTLYDAAIPPLAAWSLP